MKPISGAGAVVLRPAGEAADLLRSLVGREVRARVLAAAAPGEATRLRIGANVFAARVEGQALRADQALFLRVERAGESGYRLLILDSGRAPKADLTNLSAAPGRLPLGLETLLREQIEPGKKLRAPAAESTRPARTLPGPATATEGLGEGLRQILERAAESSEALAQWLTNSAESLDTQLFIEWSRGSANDATGESVERGTDWIAGVGRLGAGPHVFLLHAHPESLGAITAVFLAGNAEFDPLHVYVSAAESGARQALAERWSDWLSSLAREGVGVAGATLLGVSAGLDVSA